jgi:hypothetical protein
MGGVWKGGDSWGGIGGGVSGKGIKGRGCEGRNGGMVAGKVGEGWVGLLPLMCFFFLTVFHFFSYIYIYIYIQLLFDFFLNCFLLEDIGFPP